MSTYARFLEKKATTICTIGTGRDMWAVLGPSLRTPFMPTA